MRFTAGGETAARSVSLGAYADEYVEGQTVTVVYDLSAPERFTIDDVPYEPEWIWWPIGISASAGVWMAVVAIRHVRAWLRTRRILTSQVWAPVHVRVGPEEDGYSFTTADDVVWRCYQDVDWPTPARDQERCPKQAPPPPGDPADQPAWWACDGRTAVFSPDQGAPLLLARRAER